MFQLVVFYNRSNNELKHRFYINTVLESIIGFIIARFSAAPCIFRLLSLVLSSSFAFNDDAP